MLDPSLIFLGPVIFIAGFIDAIAGGGGLLTVPAYLIAGIPPTLTLGTNKFVSTIGTFVSTSRYIINKRVLWPVAIVGIPFSLIGAMVGANTVAFLPQDLVRKVILIALPVAAVLVLIPKPKDHQEIKMEWRTLRLWILTPLITFSIGWYDGIFGPGTGSLLVLALYGIGRLNFLHSAATARVFNLISNIGALVTFLIHGKVLFAIGIPLAFFGMVGHYAGAHLALKKGDELVRGMLALSCTILFVYLLLQHFYKN